MNNIIKRSFNYVRYVRKTRGFKYLLGEVCFVAARISLRNYFQPSLSDFNSSGFISYHNGTDVIAKILPTTNSKQMGALLNEYFDLSRRLETRLSSPRLEIEPESRLLLYMLVRLARPKTVVETGVANGVSTFFILNALRSNNFGLLTSIDISVDVATFLNDDEKQRWNLEVLDVRKNPRKQFEEIINNLPNISIYLHDSDHSYTWQKMEYMSAYSRLEQGGILLSDDVDSSYAFIDIFGRSTKIDDLRNKGIL
ncbi:MAG: class I SAM-dependent methyltransferase, partial [Nitrososphaeria archaeon]